MIEANNPEIDVDELMQQVREEVARRKSLSNLAVAVDKCSSELNTRSTVNINPIEALLNNADLYSQVPTKFPEKFNRFPFKINQGLQKFLLKVYGFLFKKQRVVNLSLIQALRESLALNRQLSEQVTALQAQLKEISNSLAAVDERFKATDEQLKFTDERFKATDERFKVTDERFKVTDERLTTLDERYITNDSYLKNDLTQQKRLITLFLAEARQRLPEPFNQEQLQTFVNEDNHLLDAFYVAFEEQFRGNRKEIVDRLKVYLSLFEEAKLDRQELPILDVGCGRGEWLELLHEARYTARGIDINRVMIEQCRLRGLEVIESDAITYLQSLPDASQSAVTGFHIIEHLSFLVLIKLITETARVLKSGGLAIFETPNPQNILVGSNNFYIDPTHRNPLPSTLTKFLLEHTGFTPVRIINLNPYDDSFKVNGSEVAERFNDYFYGPQDYAVVGYKL